MEFKGIMLWFMQALHSQGSACRHYSQKGKVSQALPAEATGTCTVGAERFIAKPLLTKAEVDLRYGILFRYIPDGPQSRTHPLRTPGFPLHSPL